MAFKISGSQIFRICAQQLIIQKIMRLLESLLHNF